MKRAKGTRADGQSARRGVAPHQKHLALLELQSEAVWGGQTGRGGQSTCHPAAITIDLAINNDIQTLRNKQKNLSARRSTASGFKYWAINPPVSIARRWKYYYVLSLWDSAQRTKEHICEIWSRTHNTEYGAAKCITLLQAHAERA